MNVMRRNDADERTNAGNNPEVAIVILNWNGKKFLEQFLPFVFASTYSNKRIIVVDNASSDDSVSFVQQHYPAAEIIINDSNEGFAKGYNTALAKVKTDYYVLLNSDIEVTPAWIEPVIVLMEADKKIAACQPKILSYHQKNLFEYAGGSGGWIDKYAYPFARGRIFDVCEEDHGQYDDAAPCFWASGAAMFVRAELFHSAGGFDPYFFAHQEEIDLCWRLQRLGYKIFVEPSSIVYHVGGGTLPQGNSRKTFLNFRNNLVMMHKNLPPEQLWKVVWRQFLDAISAWRALLKGDVGFFMAVLRAHAHYARWIFFGQYKKIKTVNSEFSGWYDGSVVWQFFIKKRRLFSEIVQRK